MSEQVIGIGIAVACLVLLGVIVLRVDKWFRSRRTPRTFKLSTEPRQQRPEDAATLMALRQNLRLKVGYDEEKIDRLIGSERVKMPNASTQALMESAIEHWERDNR
jgi:hypothetical protein